MKKFALFLAPLMAISFLANCGGIKQYTVTFDPNGGKWTDGSANSKTITVKEGEKAKKPGNPTKNPVEAIAYTFDYWESDNKEFNFNTPITNNITLKAKWSQGTRVCSVVIDNNELYGETTGAGSFDWNSKVKLTATPKGSYVFMGWQKGEEIIDTNQVYEFNVTDDVILTTVYKSSCLIDCQIGFSLDNAFTIEKYTSESEADISFPNSVLYKNVEYEIYHIAPNAFERAKFKSIGLPSTLKTIGFAAFRNCKSLTSISIPSGVMTIMGATFYYCSNLTEVTFNKDSEITSIYNDAFCETKIKSIKLPPKLTYIGSRAFGRYAPDSCLETVDLSDSILDKPIDCENDIFEKQEANITIRVKNSLQSAYQAHSVWGKYNIVGV